MLLDLIASPWVVLPTAAGLTALLVAWGANLGGAVLSFLGVASLLAGAGALVTRWVVGHDAIAKRAFEEIQDEAERHRREALDTLSARLEGDNDPRTGQCLGALRELDQRLSALLDSGAGGRRAPDEIAALARKLMRSSIMSLERSLQLWQTAHNMVTEQARKPILESREQLLDEVNQSITQLAQVLDQVQTLGLDSDPGRQLAAVRRELDESLSVAKRVEERIHSLEKDLDDIPPDFDRE